MSLGTIQIPVLFDMSGNTIVFGEEVSGDFVNSHLDFALDMTTEANGISLNAADISSAILIGDQETADNIFYSGGSNTNVGVDNLCNRIAKAITRGKLVHLPKTGNTSNSGIPMGGRSNLYDLNGVYTENGNNDKYAIKYFSSIAPIGDEQMLGQAMARVASVHLVGHPLSAGIFQDKNQIQTDLETASAQTFNSDNTAFYNALAVQLSKVLGGSKSSAPMNNGLTNTTTTTTFNAGTKITANDGGSSDQFGSTVDVSGNYAIIGAPNWDNGGSGNNEGAAYIFNVTTGAQLHKLTADDGAEGDTFGHGAAIDGNYAIVGAHSDGNSSGSAYVFDVTNGNQLRKLTADDAATGDYFGRHVAISGNYAIISAYGDNDNGSAYIFNVTNGNQVHKLASSDGASNDDFGYSVSIDGNNAIVSTMGKNSYQGAAYIFNVTTGNQVHKLTASDGQSNDYFGRDSSIYGNYAIVGADGEGTTGGAAYIFDVTTGNQLHKLTADDGAADDYFGASVAIYGNYAVVGAAMDDDGASDSGSVYIFDVTTGNQLQKLTAGDQAANERFGASVAITDNYFVFGKPYDANGSAYIFTSATNTTTSYALDASGVSVPALKSIYEQLMNVPGRSQIMQTRDVSGVVDNSNVTLTGGFPFISGDKLVMFLRPKINFSAQTQPVQHSNALVGFSDKVIFNVPLYNIADLSGSITSQTYTHSSAQDNTLFGFNRAVNGDGVAGANYFTSANGTYDNTSGVHTGAGQTANVDGTTTIDGEWGEVDIRVSTFVKELSLTTNKDYQYRMPTEFRLLGSNDGTNWETLIHETGLSNWTVGTPQTFQNLVTKPFRYYRYVVITIDSPSGNADARTSLGHFNLQGSLATEAFVQTGGKAAETGFQPIAQAVQDISGLITNFTATPQNIEEAFPGNATTGPEAEALKWGWLGSTNSDTLSLDTTDIQDNNIIDLHIWKITITL